MLKLSFIYAGLLAVCSLATTSVQAAEISAEMLSQTCAGCHGTLGKVENSAFMKLAGMPQATFIKGMQDFASGARPYTLMGPIAKGFSASEIQAMADYFAAIKP